MYRRGMQLYEKADRRNLLLQFFGANFYRRIATVVAEDKDPSTGRLALDTLLFPKKDPRPRIAKTSIPNSSLKARQP
jgi:hypothetical protein